MLEIILFLFPSCIAMLVHKYIFKKEHNTKEFIMIFGAYVCLLNICSVIVLNLYSSTLFYINENVYRLNFVMKYLGLSMIFAVLVPVVLGFINKNFTIKVDFKKVNNEKKRKKHS